MKIAALLKRKPASSITLFLSLMGAISANASLTITTFNQQGALPFTPSWTPASASLIAGMNPSSSGGNFSEETTGRNVSSLTIGGSLTIGVIPNNTTTTNYITCGNGYGAGSNIVYTLPQSQNGYNLTNITVYGGWKDNGRDQQAYTIYYSTISNPGSFSPLTSVNFNPSVPSGTASATQVIISDSGGGVVASNVAAVEFDFTSPVSENGYCGYAAITMQGVPSSVPTGPPMPGNPGLSPASASMGTTAGTVVTLTASATGKSPIGYQWRTDGGSGGLFTNIPGATGANLTINTIGYAMGTYRYDFTATNSLGTNTSPDAQIAIVGMIDIGASAPMPGSVDISQLLNTSQNDDGINYYTDDGAAYGNWCGQTFVTGSNPNGYLLTSLAWKSAGNGNSFGTIRPYDLYFYSVSPDGSRATVIASYQGSGGGTENDWFQWQGLNVPLAPNQTYAYAFGRDASSSGWEHIANQSGNPYPQGQIMTVANTTGAGVITYGTTGNSDATFDLGIVAYPQAAPRATQPYFANGSWPVYAGNPGSFTLQENALGTGPFTYQWLGDNGSGGAMTALTGATSSNLVVNTTNLSAATYNYAVVVSNAFGYSISPSFAMTVLGPTAPSVATDINPAPVQVVNVGQQASFFTSFTGTTPITYQWYFNNGFGPAPISNIGNSGAESNAVMLSSIQLTNDGIYSVIAQNAAGSVTSSVSTLVVLPLSNSPPSAATVPPVYLQITNSAGKAHVQWAQGTLQQATNLQGPWMPVATNLQLTSFVANATNPATFFRSIPATQPRIVNLYCFCRDQDFRLANSQAVLFNTTTQQVQLFKQAGLPATFALQHDALVDTNYQNYFKANLATNDEIGAWWEITQTLCERAGIAWRGAQEWDPTADVDFSCGYTPAQRIQLVDAYMADFYAIFGYYPKTVGSWYIDEVTLQYMQQQYGVVASANCKDQLGTDTYTLWGSYWNQAYYPSKLNAYMPAQTTAGQINMPIFRMLGSDPIYQYGGSVTTLEPVYPSAGGSASWVAWFMDNLIKQPSLAFGYAQAGQENDIQSGWSSMGPALTRQVQLMAAQAQAGEIKVETLEQAGQWFRNNYSKTPPTSVAAIDDWQNQGRKSVWYDSRFYRLNLLWDQGTFYVRDLHCFNENVTSPTFSNVLATTYFDYETLPIMDSGQWSGNGTNPVGMWPIVASSGGHLIPQGMPVVKELDPTDMNIAQPLSGGGAFAITCTESNVTCVATNALGQPLNWSWLLVGGSQQASEVQNVGSNGIAYNYNGTGYQLRLDAGSCQEFGNSNISLIPDANGRVVLDLDVDY